MGVWDKYLSDLQQCQICRGKSVIFVWRDHFVSMCSMNEGEKFKSLDYITIVFKNHKVPLDYIALSYLLRSPSKKLVEKVADMIFVRNFTQPDFPAKSCTAQKCVICDIFLAN